MEMTLCKTADATTQKTCVTLKKGDCLELMKQIPDGSVDMVLCDLPYGTMKGAGLDGWDEGTTSWDERLDTGRLLTEYERILRENGTCILFSQEPYTSELRKQQTANLDFAYPMIWKKDHFANALIAKKAPVSYFEDLSVFYKPYDRQLLNPLRVYAKQVFDYIGKPKQDLIREIGQRADHFFRMDSMQFAMCSAETYEELIGRYHIDKMQGFRPYAECKEVSMSFRRVFNLPYGCKFTENVLDFKKDYQGLHPTQKPVALLEHLVRLYTNERDAVLDNCMGSGSTGCACVRTGRSFIGIELDDGYFDVAAKRVQQEIEKSGNDVRLVMD